MDNSDKKRWFFAVKVHDKPGMVTAVSSVFSNRGVSLEMLLGSTLHAVSADAIDLFVVFMATEPRKNELLRTIRRLAKVISVECYNGDSPTLRAVAFAHVSQQEGDVQVDLASVATEESVVFSPVIFEDKHQTWILMATPSHLQHCLDRLQDAKILLDVTVTIIPVETPQE